MNNKIIIVTGDADSAGRRCAKSLAQSGHTVYVALREGAGGTATAAEELALYAYENAVDLRALTLGDHSQASVNAAMARVAAAHGRIHVVVHNAQSRAWGPAEAFTDAQFALCYEHAVLSAQRVNRSVLPYMRRVREGLLVWLSHSATAGGGAPYCAPHMAAMAALDSLAVQYARELARWGIETSIVVAGQECGTAPPAFPVMTPADAETVAAYEHGPYASFGARLRQAFAAIAAEDWQGGAIAGAILCLVETPGGERPFRVHVGTGQTGADIAYGVIDRVREELLYRVGLADLLKAHRPGAD